MEGSTEVTVENTKLAINNKIKTLMGCVIILFSNFNPPKNFNTTIPTTSNIIISEGADNLKPSPIVKSIDRGVKNTIANNKFDV